MLISLLDLLRMAFILFMPFTEQNLIFDISNKAPLKFTNKNETSGLN